MKLRDVSKHIPSILRQVGCSMTLEDNGSMSKYVLTCPKYGYRGFIYIRNDRKDREGDLSNLYADLCYKHNLGTISTYGEGRYLAAL